MQARKHMHARAHTNTHAQAGNQTLSHREITLLKYITVPVVLMFHTGTDRAARTGRKDTLRYENHTSGGVVLYSIAFLQSDPQWRVDTRDGADSALHVYTYIYIYTYTHKDTLDWFAACTTAMGLHVSHENPCHAHSESQWQVLNCDLSQERYQLSNFNSCS